VVEERRRSVVEERSRSVVEERRRFVVEERSRSVVEERSRSVVEEVYMLPSSAAGPWRQGCDLTMLSRVREMRLMSADV